MIEIAVKVLNRIEVINLTGFKYHYPAVRFVGFDKPYFGSESLV